MSCDGPMIPSVRQDFNRRYRAEQYPRLLRRLRETAGTPIEFRVAETPCFFPAELMQRAAAIGIELTSLLVNNSAYLEASAQAIPRAFRVPRLTAHPHFMTADFGLVRTPGGELELRLVELQAFPS